MKNKRSYIFMRYGVVSVIITLMAVAIIYKAVRNTIIDADKWNAKADSILNRVHYEQPVRGEILAADGTVLATNLEAYDIKIDYRAMAPRAEKFILALDSIAEEMAHYYPQRNKAGWREHLARPLADSAHLRPRSYTILRRVTYADYKRIEGFPFFKNYRSKYRHGLTYEHYTTRVMPYGQMAQRSIGRCSKVRAPKFEGATKRRDSTDVLRGYSGLECALDSLLYGEVGTMRIVPLTRRVTTWVENPAQNGKTVRTTIDINMQDIVETELTEMLQTTRAKWGTCVLMEVATGDIKAISNLDRADDGTYIEAMNYALQPYEPGSVMKPITMAVAMHNGYANLNAVYPIGHSYAYGGAKPIRDTHSPGSLPVSRFLEYSSNIGMAKLMTPHYDRNHLNDFREQLRELGFLDSLGTGMKGERRPQIPTLDPKAGGHVSLSRMVYGYNTKIPPLYTCAFYNAIANDGRFVRPRLYRQLISADGTVEDIPIDYVRDQIITPSQAAQLRQMIRQVVWGEGGTAKTLRNETVDIAGKTGTCIIAKEAPRDPVTNRPILTGFRGGYNEGHYRLAFCGFFPYEKPLYTCIVVISDPAPQYKGAAATSGTVLKNIALRMYAHGMLDYHSDFTREANATQKHPTLHWCSDARLGQILAYSGARSSHRMSTPAAVATDCTPDLIGLGLRDAVERAEKAGYTVSVSGQGHAVSQTPPAGDPIAPGGTIQVIFRK